MQRDDDGLRDDPSGLRSSVDELERGRIFAGRFEVEAPLGAGAMGRVVRVRDVRSGHRVALKCLHPDRVRDPESLGRFQREAQVLAAIGHPAIVRVFEVGQTDTGVPWIAMELVAGSTLASRLRSAPITPLEIIPLLNALCDGLAAAHERGVVHRDLKPENLLVPSDGSYPCKLLDFGLSRVDTEVKLTRKGATLGTPRYMAPEQIRAASCADLRSDVYSVGVMLYEMLAGRSPYPAEDMAQLLGCVVGGRVVPLESIRPDLPLSVAKVVARAMAHDPDARFQTAGAIAEAYASALGVSSGRSSLHGNLFEDAVVDPSKTVLEPFGSALRDTEIVGFGGPPRSSATGPGPGDRNSWMAPAEFTRPTLEPPRPSVSAARPSASGPRPRGRGVKLGIAFVLVVLVVLLSSGIALGIHAVQRGALTISSASP